MSWISAVAYRIALSYWLIKSPRFGFISWWTRRVFNLGNIHYYFLISAMSHICHLLYINLIIEILKINK